MTTAAPTPPTPPTPTPATVPAPQAPAAPRDEAGRFAPKAPAAPAAAPVTLAVPPPEQKFAPATPPAKEAPKGPTPEEKAANDQRDQDAFDLATGKMTKDAFDAKWEAPNRVIEPTERKVTEWKADTGDETGEKAPKALAAEPKAEAGPDERTVRLDALEVLRKDYGVEYTRDTLSKLPLDVLKSMAAERKPRQDKITQSFDSLKSGKRGTLHQPKGTTPEDNDSPTTGASKQRTTAKVDPLDEELDALSELDPEVTAKTRSALEAARKERDEALQQAEQAREAGHKARFQAAVFRAAEAHPQLRTEGVRKAFLTAMQAKDPEMEVLTGGDDDELDALIESVAVRVIPPETTKPPENKTPKGTPDMDTRRSKVRTMTQDDKDALAFEAIQKVGADPAAVERYIQGKLGGG